jgi:predicted esterase
MTMRDLRVLCLHGYHGSAAFLRHQLEPLAPAFPPGTDLVYVNAPSLITDGYSWWEEGFTGWETTRDWIIELVSAGPPIDGVFGFSQGAALAGLLAGVRDTPAAPIAFDFAIMVSGFTSFAPQHADLFRGKLTVPSAHIMGRADTVVPPRDSLRLADRFDAPLIIEHDGGHVIPAGPAVAAQLASFLAQFTG